VQGGKGGYKYNAGFKTVKFIFVVFPLIIHAYRILGPYMEEKRGALSLVSTIEELLKRKGNGSGLENRDYGCRGSAVLTTQHPSIRRSWH
jgi:hypothetical protein